MLVLIDESGCPGFKLIKGSSPYFVVAMVIFSNLMEAQNASASIEVLRNELRAYPEFKFNKTHEDKKDIFFDTVCQFDFKVRAIVINKAIIYSHHLRDNTESFYNFFVQNLMKHDDNILNNASIKIDGSGDREFQRALSAYLRRSVGQGKIKKFKFVDSKKDNLIQLADMTVGAVARSYNHNRNNGDRWLKMLRKSGKIDNIWDYK